METILTTFSNFRNRYYKSTYGAQSCRWLIQQIKDVASGNSNVSVNQFDHSVSLLIFFVVDVADQRSSNIIQF